jgi:predicted membrane protein (TIGR00267 family)
MKTIPKLYATHTEKHTPINWISDVILGGQDGLVNALGIVLGFSAASQDSKILIAGTLAAACAEAISMAAVAYTSTVAQADHYDKEIERENWEVDHWPDKETQEIRDIYTKKGFSGNLLEEVVATITKDRNRWVSIMMDEELGLEKIDRGDILRTPVIVGAAALLASLVPIVSFFFLSHQSALIVSVILSAIVLFAIGTVEAKKFVGSWKKKGVQMVVIGLGAAFIGYVIGKLFSSI